MFSVLCDWLSFKSVYILFLICKSEVNKILKKIAKEKGCQELLPWVKPCVNHLYWSAMSTEDGDRQVIWAKFSSFLEHMANVHSNLPNPIFNACAHGDDIEERIWLNKGKTFV